MQPAYLRQPSDKHRTVSSARKGQESSRRKEKSMENVMGKLVYFNNRKDAGKMNQFIWSLSGNILHVFQGDRELPENSSIYKEIKRSLNL